MAATLAEAHAASAQGGAQAEAVEVLAEVEVLVVAGMV